MHRFLSLNDISQVGEFAPARRVFVPVTIVIGAVLLEENRTLRGFLAEGYP